MKDLKINSVPKAAEGLTPHTIVADRTLPFPTLILTKFLAFPDTFLTMFMVLERYS